MEALGLHGPRQHGDAAGPAPEEDAVPHDRIGEAALLLLLDLDAVAAVRPDRLPLPGRLPALSIAPEAAGEEDRRRAQDEDAEDGEHGSTLPRRGAGTLPTSERLRPYGALATRFGAAKARGGEERFEIRDPYPNRSGTHPARVPDPAMSPRVKHPKGAVR